MSVNVQLKAVLKIVEIVPRSCNLFSSSSKLPALCSKLLLKPARPTAALQSPLPLLLLVEPLSATLTHLAQSHWLGRGRRSPAGYTSTATLLM